MEARKHLSELLPTLISVSGHKKALVEIKTAPEVNLEILAILVQTLIAEIAQLSVVAGYPPDIIPELSQRSVLLHEAQTVLKTREKTTANLTAA